MHHLLLHLLLVSRHFVEWFLISAAASALPTCCDEVSLVPSSRASGDGERDRRAGVTRRRRDDDTGIDLAGGAPATRPCLYLRLPCECNLCGLLGSPKLKVQEILVHPGGLSRPPLLLSDKGVQSPRANSSQCSGLISFHGSLLRSGGSFHFGPSITTSK